jgi:hypothetical protein
MEKNVDRPGQLAERFYTVQRLNYCARVLIAGSAPPALNPSRMWTSRSILEATVRYLLRRNMHGRNNRALGSHESTLQCIYVVHNRRPLLKSSVFVFADLDRFWQYLGAPRRLTWSRSRHQFRAPISATIAIKNSNALATSPSTNAPTIGRTSVPSTIADTTNMAGHQQ